MSRQICDAHVFTASRPFHAYALRRTVRQRLQDYCGLDTLGMVQIVEAMRRISGE